MIDTAANTDLDLQVNRRGFLKGCTMVAAALGISEAMIPKLVEAASSAQRPPVIWLHFQECTGCTESLLRGSHPDLARLITEIISLDYHETVMAAAGHQAEKSLRDTLDKYAGKFLCVVEGAIPTKDKGIYCKIAGRTAVDILAEVAPKAAAIIAIGSCSSYGGIQAAAPNPTGAKGVMDLVSGTPVINYLSDQAGAEQTLAMVEEAGSCGEVYPFDIRDGRKAEEVIEDIAQRLGRIDVLVNNAGIIHDGLFMMMEPASWHSVIDTSLTGFYNMTRPVCITANSRAIISPPVTSAPSSFCPNCSRPG